MYGIIHEEIVSSFDYFGYGDLDVIYGDIRSFYDDNALCNNTLSTHRWCLSGHLTLIRNEQWLRDAFRRLRGWQNLVCDNICHRFDEDFFRYAFMYPQGLPLFQHRAFDLMDPGGVKYRKNNYWVEQFTTPLTPRTWLHGEDTHPEVWFWKEGIVTNTCDGARTFIYLHFMNFKSPRYMHSRYQGRAPWKDIRSLLASPLEELVRGFQIDFTGFRAL
jgi:hypothetical protein